MFWYGREKFAISSLNMMPFVDNFTGKDLKKKAKLSCYHYLVFHMFDITAVHFSGNFLISGNI